MLYIVTLCAFSFYKLIGKLTAFLQLCQVVGSSCCPQSVNSFYGKVGKTLRSHKNQFGDRGHRN